MKAAMIVLNVTTEGRTRLLGLSRARSWVLASSHSPCSFRVLLHRTRQDRVGGCKWALPSSQQAQRRSMLLLPASLLGSHWAPCPHSQLDSAGQ